MGRIPVSGSNAEAIVALATDARWVIPNLDPDGDGRIFYLQGLSIANEDAVDDGVFELWDADEGATPGATTQRGTFLVPPATTLVLGEETFGPDGIPFVTNCVASLAVGTISGAAAVVAIGGVLARGYLA